MQASMVLALIKRTLVGREYKKFCAELTGDALPYLTYDGS